ncbi:MAG: hypothetical protein EOP09_19145, partial [Proteobacteria bacterium]
MTQTLGYSGDYTDLGFSEATAGVAGPGLPLPVWVSEGSPYYNANPTRGMYEKVAVIKTRDDARISADLTARYIAGLLQNGVEKFFMYTIHSPSSFGVVHPYQALVTDDGSLHPSAVAYSTAAHYLDESRPSGILRLKNGATAYLFEKRSGRGASAFISARVGKGLPAGMIGSDLGLYDVYGNPLRPSADAGTTAYVDRADIFTLRSVLEPFKENRDDPKTISAAALEHDGGTRLNAEGFLALNSGGNASGQFQVKRAGDFSISMTVRETSTDGTFVPALITVDGVQVGTVLPSASLGSLSVLTRLTVGSHQVGVSFPSGNSGRTLVLVRLVLTPTDDFNIWQKVA